MLKAWLQRLAAVTFGFVLIGGAIAQSQGSEVECGGDPMRPGQSCTTIRKGKSTTRTYEEQKSENTRETWVMLGVGTLMLAGGSYSIIRLVRRSRRQRNAGGPLPSGAAPQHQAPQPGVPQQGGVYPHRTGAPYGAYPEPGVPVQMAQGYGGQPQYGVPPQPGQPHGAYPQQGGAPQRTP